MSDVRLNVYYKTSNFINAQNKNNYGEIFSDLINNQFSLFVNYLEIFFWVNFNLLKGVTDIVLFNYFASQNVAAKSNKRLRLKVHRMINNYYCIVARTLLRYINCCIDPKTIKHFF